MTRLQVALDRELSAALEILEKASAFVDIIEIGTPLIFREGMHAVRAIRAAYPDHCLLADLKIMDAGEAESDIAFKAGVNMVTVMAVASDATIQGALNSATAHQRQVMIDMMEIADPVGRAKALMQLGDSVFCVHTAHDLQSRHGSPWHQLGKLRQAYPELTLAIAGGVNLTRLAQIMPYRPQIIVVGSAITAAADPGRAARQLHEGIHAYGYD